LRKAGPGVSIAPADLEGHRWMLAERKALEIAEAFIKQHPLPAVGWKKY
jgi:hypothetical protein